MASSQNSVAQRFIPALRTPHVWSPEVLSVMRQVY